MFRSTLVLLLITLASQCLSVAGSAAADTLPQLQIGVKHKLASCPIVAQQGDYLSMHYSGKLATGEPFDSSVDRGMPFDFVLGKGSVIQGWEKGLMGMCIGEKRKLRVPPHLGYGNMGAGGVIPPGATLVFEVELLDIKNRRVAKPDL